MERPAPADHLVHELIARRWSPRAFGAESIPPAALRSLLEAARWAPSSYNEQPWVLLVARREEQETFARALSCLVEFNQSWAHAAPVLLLPVARTTFRRNGKPNPHAWHDVGLAMMNLTVQATSMGLVVHQMAGILPERVREAFSLPDGHEPVSAAAVGWPGDPASLPEPLRAKETEPRVRAPQDEFVFAERFGDPLRT